MSVRRAAGAALWLAFASLVVAGGWLFLRACALDALGLDFCPMHAGGAALWRETAVGDDLVRQVHMAQMAVAEAPLCAPPAPPPSSPVPVPTPALQPPARAETETIDRKVVERGGHNGRLQFTLEWATLDDLDLNVECPGGRIGSEAGHAGPGICGDGRKDVDANRNLVENVSSTPIENVVWQDDIPSGPYRIEVIEYRGKGDVGNTVPFTLRLRWNDQERVCRDAVTNLPIAPKRSENGRVLGGTAKLIAWTFGDTLPDCTFVSADTIRGGPAK